MTLSMLNLRNEICIYVKKMLNLSEITKYTNR